MDGFAPREWRELSEFQIISFVFEVAGVSMGTSRRCSAAQTSTWILKTGNSPQREIKFENVQNGNSQFNVGNQRPLANSQENPVQMFEFPEMKFWNVLIVPIFWPICALCEMSEFEMISVIFPREMWIAKSMGDLHRLCNDKNVCNLGAFFCLSVGETALHFACNRFFAEVDADTLFLFWGSEGKLKCVEMLVKREDLDVNIKNRWHSKQFSVWIKLLVHRCSSMSKCARVIH